MAGTAAPRRKRAKQQRLAGVEPEERIKEIEDAADDYVDCRDERMGFTEKETAAKEALIKVMKKHKREVYRGDGFIITATHTETDDVKVKKVEEKKQDGEKDFGGE